MNDLNKIISFCTEAIKILNNSNNFGRDYVYLKILFFNQFQNRLVFSTRFGADFFEEVLIRIKEKQIIIPEKGFPLGEYDKNFNQWLLKLIS